MVCSNIYSKMSDNEHGYLTFYDLCSKLDSDESALEFALQTEILPSRNGLNCISCSGIQSVVWMKRLSQSSIPYILFCKSCRKTISLSKSTVFAGSRLSLRQFFLNTYCWILGLTPKEAAAQSNMNFQMSNSHFILNREVCYILLSNESQILGGPGQTIEIGDMTVKRRKYQNKLNEKHPHKPVVYQTDTVFLGYNIDSKELFILKVAKADLNTLLEIIMTMVLPGSRVIVDNCSKYSEFAVENYDISFYEELIGVPNKNEPKRLKFHHREPLSKLIRNPDYSLLLCEQFYMKRKEAEVASERFYPFISDFAKVYPGYGKVPLQPLSLSHFVNKID